MRLTSVQVIRGPQGDMMALSFRASGVPGNIGMDLPSVWDDWDRTEKIEWARDQVQAYLADHVLSSPNETVYPDTAAPDEARDGFEALPGWAHWTPAEAEAWVLTNVNDLQTARQVMAKMARAIMYLRNIVIEQ